MGLGRVRSKRNVSWENHSENIWDKLLFSCEITHYGKSLISVFQELIPGLNKIYILAGGLGTRLPLYELLALSYNFLISHDPKS